MAIFTEWKIKECIFLCPIVHISFTHDISHGISFANPPHYHSSLCWQLAFLPFCSPTNIPLIFLKTCLLCCLFLTFCGANGEGGCRHHVPPCPHLVELHHQAEKKVWLLSRASNNCRLLTAILKILDEFSRGELVGRNVLLPLQICSHLIWYDMYIVQRMNFRKYNSKMDPKVACSKFLDTGLHKILSSPAPRHVCRFQRGCRNKHPSLQPGTMVF